MKQDTKRGLKRQRDYLASDRDELAAQLARLAEAARAVRADEDQGGFTVIRKSLSRLRAVLDEIEGGKP